MKFEFATAARIIFGSGTLTEAGPLVAALGKRALIVTGRDESRAAPILKLLARDAIETDVFSVAGEPTVERVREGVAVSRQKGSEFIVAIGGGSALDAGKAIAGLTTNQGEVVEFLEVIGAGKPLTRPGLPFVAVPTTAGTGTEVTRNAVLASPVHRVKVSLRSPLLLARIAIIDPDLLHGIPAAVAAFTGLDALTQLIEPFVSVRANPMTDALCREAIPKAARSVPRMGGRNDDAGARQDMAWASLCGGLALANAALGAVHGFAAPLGGMFPVPHGAICAVLLPHVMAANLSALRAREPHSPALGKDHEVARLLTGSTSARAEDGVQWMRALCQDLAIARLRYYGIKETDLAEIAEKSAGASSMKGNPVVLSEAERIQILQAAL